MHAGWLRESRRVLLWLWLLPTASVSADGLEVHGVFSARGLRTTGQSTWLERGFGRLADGATGPDESANAFRGQVHLGVTWKPSELWSLHVQGVAQGEPDSYGGRPVGVAEGFLQFRPELTPDVTLRFRAGAFFPGTSLENADPLWQSPYTVTLSALNTWTAEEQRLTGLDSAIFLKGGPDRFELAGAVFGANDTLGTLIAWRGWSMGDRLTTLAEPLPLPPLSTLAPGGPFAAQRRDTIPTDELENRPGWQVRGRWSRPDTVTVQAAYLDTRGDRALHAAQYSWKTTFVSAGAEIALGSSLRLLAEGVHGDTGMGGLADPHVDVRIRAGYVLLSWKAGEWRVSGRLDGFRNEDRDGTAEPNGESGWAWTLAAFWHPAESVRLGAEYLDLRAERPAAAFSHADPNTDARRGLLELRVRF